MISVGVNGYGVIGRRVADAISVQQDMKLAGVTKIKPDYKAKMALEKRYALYAATESSLKEFENRGIEVSGTLEDLLAKVDMIVDASPDNVGARNKEKYVNRRRSVIFQGGESPEVAELSFVAQCNFEKARGAKFIRVVSCNTTALCRALYTVNESFGIERARAVIARRAADPDEISKGPIDAVVLDPIEIPSHHAGDVNTVLPQIKLATMAIKVPTTHMHLHTLIVSLRDRAATEDQVIDAFENATRIMVIEGDSGLKSTAQVIDLAREMGRPRNDLYEAVIWKDSVRVIEGELHFYMGVHQEAIVVPENIDAIRASLGNESSRSSISATNLSLGILK